MHIISTTCSSHTIGTSVLQLRGQPYILKSKHERTFKLVDFPGRLKAYVHQKSLVFMVSKRMDILFCFARSS